MRFPGQEGGGVKLGYLQCAQIFGFPHGLPEFTGIGMVFVNAFEEGRLDALRGLKSQLES